MARARHALLVAAALAAASLPAVAINDLFAKDAPIARMTEEDFRIAGAVIRDALEQGQEGRKYEWKNQATAASGSVVLRGAFERQGMHCRGAEFVITAGGRTAHSAWNLCKTPDGWKVAEGR